MCLSVVETMHIFIVVLCCSLVFGFGNSHSEIVEVPLAELHGVYYSDYLVQRTAHFELDVAPSVVYGVWIRLVGECHVRDWYCEFTGTFPQPVWFHADVSDSVSGEDWQADPVTPTQSGAFDIRGEFVSQSDATWDALKNGRGEVSLLAGGDPIVGLCWPIASSSDAIVSGAFLVIDGDFSVPNESATWGRIKALYDVK